MIRAIITQREQKDTYGASVDILEAYYTQYFERMGFMLTPVSNFTKDTGYYARDAGLLILTGGGDLGAEYYADGRNPIEQSHRDRTEKRLLEQFLSFGIPVLAICRGMQYINGLYGGKIRRLENLHTERKIRHDHSVLLCSQSKRIMVNQYHNDGIFCENLGSGLETLALDEENGIVEAFQAPGEKLLALQWHPERPYENAAHAADTDELVAAFVRRYCCKGGDGR